MLRELRELGFWRHHGVTAAIAYCLIMFARVLGVAGGESISVIALRTAIHIIVAYPFFTIGAHIAMTALPNRLPLIVRAIIGCVAAAPIIALISPLATWTLGVMPAHIYQGPTRADLASAISTNFVKITEGYATFGAGIWLFFNFEWWRARMSGLAQRSTNEITDTAADGANRERQQTASALAGPMFIRRLSPEKRGELWALTAEQHYLRVYTSKGDDLILLRFADAIAELGHADGLKIHRSHWVARAGVEKLEEEDQRLFIVLRNGVRLPVSRPNIGAAKLHLPPISGADGDFPESLSASDATGASSA